MNEDQLARILTERGWTFVGVGFFIPELDPTVDAFGPDGHEIRAYPPANYGCPGRMPTCELTDMTSETSLWTLGVPDAAHAGRLMKQYSDVLVAATYGIGEYVLDLESGNVVPEGQTRDR